MLVQLVLCGAGRPGYILNRTLKHYSFRWLCRKRGSVMSCHVVWYDHGAPPSSHLSVRNILLGDVTSTLTCTGICICVYMYICIYVCLCTTTKNDFFGRLFPLSVWRLVGRGSGFSDLGLAARIVSYRTSQIATWLILPEVIRSSQRLSHACLSLKTFYTWNCEWLIISVIVYLIIPYYSDTCSNSRANTCIKTQLSWKGCIY